MPPGYFQTFINMQKRNTARLPAFPTRQMSGQMFTSFIDKSTLFIKPSLKLKRSIVDAKLQYLFSNK